MTANNKTLKIAAANRVFAPLERDQRGYDNAVAKLPLLTTGVGENDQFPYEFLRIDQMSGRIRVPGPNGPRYFLIKVTEQI